jgi:hypothetical protein
MATAATTTWNVAMVPTPAGGWNAVAYGAGQWVAIGPSGDVAISSDGSTWADHAVPAGPWQTLSYGDGQFVALSSTVGGTEELVSSTGRSWSAETGPAGTWAGLTYGNDRFVAVGSDGQIDTSTNGTQWSAVWSHSNYSFTSVTYGNGHFVATDDAMGAVAISTNGLVWSRLFPASTLVPKWSTVVFGNGNFEAFAGTNSTYYATSVNATVWTVHQLSPTQGISAATFGCGSFLGVGQSTGGVESFFSSTSGTAWTSSAVPTDSSSDWTAISYGARRFVAVDSSGAIAWSTTTANCSAVLPASPQQVSGNIVNGRVWTYMHPPASPGSASVDSYRVNISDGSLTKHCSAPVYFEPNCIVTGLKDNQVYWLTAQSHNRFGYSVPTDPEFVIPVTSANLSAVASHPVIALDTPLVVQVTGVRANGQGIYPDTIVTVHVGTTLATCRPNPFGQCLITISHPTPGRSSIYATYTGYGVSFRSPASYVTVQS